MSAGVDLPTGIRVLHHDGPGPAPVSRLLAVGQVEADPERKGIRLLLVCAAHMLPDLPLDQFTVVAMRLLPQLAGLSPALVADVARRAGLV